MGKTFEALRRAEEERKADELQPVPYMQKPLDPFPRAPGLQPAPGWCQELWAKTQLDTKAGGIRSLLFTGATAQAGCTTTVASYAVYLASRIPAKVLVLDMNSLDPCGLRRFFRQEKGRFTVEILNTRTIQSAGSFESIRRNLVVVSNDGEPFQVVSSWLASEYFSEFMAKAAEQFDVILMDAAPVALSLETRVLSAKVDGAILIVEAGRSRRAVAQRAKKELEDSGANLIGSIISKRRFYIPNWLYSRL